MKNLFLIIMLIASQSLLAINQVKPSVGDGSKEKPYQITSVSNLFWFSGLVNGTLEDQAQNANACAILMNDITINKGTFDEEGNNTKVSNPTEWVPIAYDYDRKFSGVFDGNNHSIYGIYCNYTGTSTSQCIGFIGNMENGGVVKNLTILNSYIKGYHTVGGFSAFCYIGNNQILNCKTNAIVKGTVFVGGICGQSVSGGTIENCTFSGTAINSGKYTGGIAGINEGSTIRNCQNHGEIKGNDYYIGGIAGDNSGSTAIISCCSNHSNMTGHNIDHGGIAGRNNYGTITNCYNEGGITSSSWNIGGICGLNGGQITNSYNIGYIQASSSSSLGAICGENTGTCSSCYYLTQTAYATYDKKYSTGIGNNHNNQEIGIYKITATTLESGSLCMSLNGGNDEVCWFQNIDKDSRDSKPVLDSKHNIVYYGYRDCLATERTYNNFGGNVTKPSHVYSDTPCPYCGGLIPRTIMGNGSCGREDVSYNMYSDGVLEITGHDEMYDYDDDWPPYHSFYDNITKVIVRDGIIGIGYSAFESMPNLTEAIIENGPIYIGEDAFWYCKNLKKLQIPSTATIDYDHICTGCSSLEEINITGEFNVFDLEDLGAVSTNAIIKYENPNAIIRVSQDFANTCNLVKNRICDNLKLTDGYNFASSIVFTAVSASYEREMTTTWGTIVLPFDVASNENVVYYLPTEVDGGTLLLTRQEVLPANTPALVENVSGSGIAVSATNVDVSDDLQPSVNNSITMYGSYANGVRVDNPSAYYIYNDKFWLCNEYFYANAFRGYFALAGTAPKTLSVIVGDGVTTGVDGVNTNNVEGYYDLSGKRFDSLQKGVNIVKTKTGESYKVIVE